MSKKLHEDMRSTPDIRQHVLSELDLTSSELEFFNLLHDIIDTGLKVIACDNADIANNIRLKNLDSWYKFNENNWISRGTTW